MITLEAPAKINWFLKVLHRREDGFHEIRSLIQKISLCDRLSFSSAPAIELQSDTDIPLHNNLVYRAARLLQDKCNVSSGASITLEKKIPMGAGLGGGSSDAATTLLGLNRLWSLGLYDRELAVFAEELGSDVPFFLYGALALVEGRGEKISTRQAAVSADLLLVKPPFEISTQWAYTGYAEKHQQYKRLSPTAPVSSADAELTKKVEKVDNIGHFISTFERVNVDRMGSNVFNDLESIAIENFPVIADVKKGLIDEGAQCSLMSGSGSTVFGVFNSTAEAENAEKRFNGFWTAVVKTITE